MEFSLLSKSRIQPIAVYIAVVATIALTRLLIPIDFAISIAAILMFGAPFLIKGDVKGLRRDVKGFFLGIAVSIALLSIYATIFITLMNASPNISRVTYSLLIIHLFLVSVPEEVFFRGYLQEEIGNHLKGIVIVSFLFSIAHFITICIIGGFIGAHCIQSILTFFPSLVMGYLYMKTDTLWASIVFHFLSNITYLVLGGL